MSIDKLLYNIKNKPIYCKSCGWDLVVEKRNIRFDQQTGSPVRFSVEIFCPQYHEMGGFYSHDRYYWEEDGHVTDERSE